MAATNSYQINYSSFLENYLPINKRTDDQIEWLEIVETNGVQRLNDLKYNYYYNGSTYSNYSTTASYVFGDRVNAGLAYKNAIYECVTASTFGFFNTDNWTKVLPIFIGYQERLKYIDSRLLFEWALNRYFTTTFRQPNFADTNKSDIYIETNAYVDHVFRIGPDDYTSSFISVVDSTELGNGSDNVWMGLDPSVYPGTGETFKIFITATAYAGFPGYTTSVSNSADGVVRQFADIINYTGLPYKIYTY